MKKIIISVVLVGLSFASNAQSGFVVKEVPTTVKTDTLKTKPISIQPEFIGFRNPESDDARWQPVLSHISKNESENDELLERIKEAKERQREEAIVPENAVGNKTTAKPPKPVISTNFAGINNGGGETPLDNTIAISEKDTIVAFVNSLVGYYTTSGVNFYSKALFNLIGDASLSNNMCDPKVIYDNVAKRFIFYVQTCDAVAANSKVIIGVSKSSNPSNGWYFYKFNGNPLNNGCWWDYPKMAVSKDEIFVTGNLFTEGANTFNQAVILQIQKTPCLTGATPLTRVWSGMPGAFTIMPCGYGQSGSYGPGIYLVSSAGSTGGSTDVTLYRITNNIASGTATMITNNISCALYSTAGDANQSGSTLKLNTGDSRVQDGFFLKGTVHFVHNVDVGSGFCGFRYYRLNVNTLSLGLVNFGNSPFSDYCFPAVVSASNDSNDNSVVIAYNESSPSMFPRTAVVSCDKTGTFSDTVVVKTGLSYVSYPFTTGSSERWGDYTGLCKKYGDPNRVVWMAGMYGGSTHTWQQWIAKIGPKNVGVENISNQEVEAKVYPNPVIDNYSLEFENPERQNIVINLTDMQGRIVVELYNGIVEKGSNLFSFRKDQLSNGIYSLNIVGANSNLKNENIVVTGK